jgi:hypothetical protein
MLEYDTRFPLAQIAELGENGSLGDTAKTKVPTKLLQQRISPTVYRMLHAASQLTEDQIFRR